jgi:ketosteroid isomerase-like protein
MNHPNMERLRAFLAAYAAKDTESIRAALADDAVWHVGGTHRMSGDYRGADAILAYFDQVGTETGGTVQLETLELLANDHRGAAFLRVTGERAGRHLDVTMAEAIHFDEEGRIHEFWAHATDQDAIDRFWT